MKKNNSSGKPFVFVNFPKTGLGNMLLIWSRGLVFAKENDFKLIVTNWRAIRWGALLRRENKKRFYWRYFKETNIFKIYWYRFKKLFKKVIIDPPIEILSREQVQKNMAYEFRNVISGEDIFAGLRERQLFIKNELLNLLHPSKKSALTQQTPFIGVHVRRGDFKLGSKLTDLTFFINAIQIIRNTAGEDLPVTVFTDAEKSEILDLLALPNVAKASNNPDIIDILLLSESKILILSAGSTFSFWAAFLSNAFVIRPTNDWVNYIKADGVETGYREIEFDEKSEMSRKFLKEKFERFLEG